MVPSNVTWSHFSMILRLLAFYLFVAATQLANAENPTGQNMKVPVVSLDAVMIAPNGVRIPEGRVLLVRKDKHYGAVILSDCRSGEKVGEASARYTSFYQGDGSGDFTRPNVKIVKGDLGQSKACGIGRLAFDFGNKNIRCGPLLLAWSGRNHVYFYSTKERQGDYGIELAPTKWTEISQVNVHSEKITWYRYDLTRRVREVP
jgi:hypothetical protein